MPERSATLTLIGGPTLLIETGGFRLLTDPTFDEAPGEYAGTGATLRKTSGPALRPDQVGGIDAVLLSHDQHFDNLDRGGRAFLPTARTTLTTPAGTSRLGGNAQGLRPWETTTLHAGDGAALAVTATPARHGPVGIEPISGDVTGFVLGFEAPGDALYITGDTVWYEGVAEIAERYHPRIVVAFAGSAQTRARFHLTMDTNDVIAAAHAFPAAKIVAIHNEGWEHFKELQADLMQAFTVLGIAERLVTLEKGKPLTLAL